VKVIEPGHIYFIPYNGKPGGQIVTFIRTDGTPEENHPGSISQEFLRVLIDRLKHKDGNVNCIENADLLMSLRNALVDYEARAWRRKQDKLNKSSLEHHSFHERGKDLPFDDLGLFEGPRDGIENVPTGDDGHLIIPE
jgi:hypothetical protein